MNTENGTISLQIPEDDTTNHTVSNILAVSNFEIRDSKDKSRIFITNDDIKKASAIYNTTDSGTTVYLQVLFDKKGTNTLKEISSGEYVTIKKDEEKNSSKENSEETENKENSSNETSSNNTTSNETTNNTTSNETASENTSSEEQENNETESKEDSQKEITLVIDGNEMITTSFETPIEDGTIALSMNTATTDSDSINETLQSTVTIATLLNSGKMPLSYTVTQNTYTNSDISQNTIQKFIYVVSAVIIIAMIFLAIKFKLRGLIAAISYIGFIALYLLVIRYTNVAISIESIVAILATCVINYILTYKLAKIDKQGSEPYFAEIKSSIIKVIPIFIISIIFTFMSWTKISTFGMSMFWGILLSELYSSTVTKNMLD